MDLLNKVLDILYAVESAMNMVLEELRKQGETRSGGYLTLFNATNKQMVFSIPLGEIPKEKEEKYRTLSLEKAIRLSGKLDDGDASSWQSRDPEKQQWGGAVSIGEGFILSFSGLPELADEALVLLIAMDATENEGLMMPVAEQIARTSDNKLFQVIMGILPSTSE